GIARLQGDWQGAEGQTVSLRVCRHLTLRESEQHQRTRIGVQGGAAGAPASVRANVTRQQEVRIQPSRPSNGNQRGGAAAGARSQCIFGGRDLAAGPGTAAAADVRRYPAIQAARALLIAGNSLSVSYVGRQCLRPRTRASGFNEAVPE